MRAYILFFFLVIPPFLAAQDQLKEADRYFEATLFEKALPLYSELLHEKESHHVRIRLAQSYAAQKELTKAIDLLKDKDERDSLILISQFYGEQQDYAQAFQALERYLTLYGETNEELLLRAGELQFLMGNLKKAREWFFKISDRSLPAQRYLVKIDLKEGSPQAALSRLEKMDPESHPEYSILMGEAYFDLKIYDKALLNFEQSPQNLALAERLLFLYALLDEKTKAEQALIQLEKERSPDEFAYLKGRYYLSLAGRMKDPTQARIAYRTAAESFLTAAEKSMSREQFLRASVEADARTQDPFCCRRALKNLDQLKDDDPYLQALISAQLAQTGQLPLGEVIQQLQKNDADTRIRYLIGALYYKDQKYETAHDHFLKVSTDDGYFWAAKSLEKSNPGDSRIKEYKKKVFEDFPASALADEAYFTYYSYRDYLQGDRAAIKHLQRFKELFPNSRYNINAFYLIGLDYKRDRKSPEGKSLRKRDLNSAIESLHDSEVTFDRLYKERGIPDEQLGYFAKVRYRSILERALGNLAIGEESQGAKKKIFYEYAVEVLNRTVDELTDPKHPYTSLLTSGEAYPQLLEESHFWLAQAYMKLEEDAQVKRVLDQMIRRYKDAKVTRGYFLSRVWYEKGALAMRQKNYREALDDFGMAEESSKGRVLSTDQKIDLWIQQSLCYKELGDNEKAMLTLSKAINDDAISALRVKAMYLRAEVYEAQGRHELARKQLEATSKKGGEWALKARQKMEEDHGKR